MKVHCPFCGFDTEGLFKNKNICAHCRKYIGENEALDAITEKRSKPQVRLDPVVRPLNIEIPKAATRKEGKTITALLWGDTHFPFQDVRVLSIVQAIAEDMTPNFLIHMGDLLDCRMLSRFDKDPERKESQQDEIDQARSHLASMRLASPQSRFILLEGNHEDRLRRALWELDGPASVLAQLTNFKRAMSWPALLGLEALRIEFATYGEQSTKAILPKFILKHGNVVSNRSGATASKEQARYNKSGASGHTHRLGAIWHRDANGAHMWAETGCTCRLDAEYCVDPDWHQGCLFLTFDAETGAVAPEIVSCTHGFGVFRGKTYGKRAA